MADIPETMRHHGIRFTKDQWAWVNKKAKESGQKMSASAVVRYCIQQQKQLDEELFWE